MDKNELKIMALREALKDRVSNLLDEFENKVADLRVEITLLAQENEQLKQQLGAYQQQAQNEDHPHLVRDLPVIDGEVVEDFPQEGE